MHFSGGFWLGDGPKNGALSESRQDAEGEATKGPQCDGHMEGSGEEFEPPGPGGLGMLNRGLELNRGLLPELRVQAAH